eukprot:Rmarinus@m.22088
MRSFPRRGRSWKSRKRLWRRRIPKRRKRRKRKRKRKRKRCFHSRWMTKGRKPRQAQGRRTRQRNRSWARTRKRTHHFFLIRIGRIQNGSAENSCVRNGLKINRESRTSRLKLRTATGTAGATGARLPCRRALPLARSWTRFAWSFLSFAGSLSTVSCTLKKISSSLITSASTTLLS